jgi:uncharacterized membrane protein
MYSICLPAKIYLILAITGMIASVYNKIGTMNLVFSALFVVVWTNVLNWICNSGYTIVSWILVLLPVISAFIMAGIYLSNQTHKK